jgi:hypothetical protein
VFRVSSGGIRVHFIGLSFVRVRRSTGGVRCTGDVRCTGGMILVGGDGFLAGASDLVGDRSKVGLSRRCTGEVSG